MSEMLPSSFRRYYLRYSKGNQNLPQFHRVSASTDIFRDHNHCQHSVSIYLYLPHPLFLPLCPPLPFLQKKKRTTLSNAEHSNSPGYRRQHSILTIFPSNARCLRLDSHKDYSYPSLTSLFSPSLYILLPLSLHILLSKVLVSS